MHSKLAFGGETASFDRRPWKKEKNSPRGTLGSTGVMNPPKGHAPPASIHGSTCLERETIYWLSIWLIWLILKYYVYYSKHVPTLTTPSFGLPCFDNSKAAGTNNNLYLGTMVGIRLRVQPIHLSQLRGAMQYVQKTENQSNSVFSSAFASLVRSHIGYWFFLTIDIQ